MGHLLGQPLKSLDGATGWLGKSTTISELKGSPLLLYFWSLSCGLCKEMLPFVSACAHYYSTCGLRTVGVHVPLQPADADLKGIQEVVTRYTLAHPIALDHRENIANRYGIRYFPSFYIYDRDAFLRHFQSGDTGLPMLEDKLRRVCIQS